jgi:hypothetical protein
MYVAVNINTYMHACRRTYIHTQTHIHTHTHTHTHIHTYIHAYIHNMKLFLIICVCGMQD